MTLGTLKERPQLVQRFVAAMAESGPFRRESEQGEGRAQQSAEDLCGFLKEIWGSELR
jgi:hypothetical protein